LCQVADAVAALKAKVDALKPQISMSLYSLKQALTRVKTAMREVNVDAQVSYLNHTSIVLLILTGNRSNTEQHGNIHPDNTLVTLTTPR